MFGLLAVLAGFVLLCLFIAYECLCGRLEAERQATVRSMVRFVLSRVRRDTSAQGSARIATASTALADPRRDAPSPGAVLFEIGLILALHLAFAAAVVMTLDACGVT